MTTFKIYNGNCLEVMKTMPDNSVDSIVTDPPYGISFMGKKWDYDVPSVEIWEECLRVLKPGGHLLAFAGTRTQHRMAVRIEDAGFEIRDMIAWVYGSGFPKSLDISKAIDKAAGAERKVIGTKVRGDVEKAKKSGVTMAAADANKNNKSIFGYGIEQITEPATDSAKQWEGWGTALKPALEPITVARKPISEKTIAENVLKHGTGGINIDGCRVSYNEALVQPSVERKDNEVYGKGLGLGVQDEPKGRFPANLIHDGSDEVVSLFPITSSGAMKHEVDAYKSESNTGFLKGKSGPHNQHGDSGSAARFFYCAKASKSDRDEGLDALKNVHPTVKPTELMRYLVKLVTPPTGTVFDPFNGSGSTGKAAVLEGFNYIGIELDPDHVKVSEERIQYALDNKDTYDKKTVSKKKPKNKSTPISAKPEELDWE